MPPSPSSLESIPTAAVDYIATSTPTHVKHPDNSLRIEVHGDLINPQAERRSLEGSELYPSDENIDDDEITDSSVGPESDSDEEDGEEEADSEEPSPSSDEGDGRDVADRGRETPPGSNFASSRLRRRSSGQVIPLWPTRSDENFARGKQVLRPAVLRLVFSSKAYSPLTWFMLQALNTLTMDPLSFTSDDLVHLTLEIFLEVSISRLSLRDVIDNIREMKEELELHLAVRATVGRAGGTTVGEVNGWGW